MKLINNVKGFSHAELFVAIIIIAFVAFVGVKVLDKSHADSSTQTCNQNTLSKGSSGECVDDTQNIINWYNSNSKPKHVAVAVTGTYEAPTIRAVKFFQKHGISGYTLPVTGEIDTSTWNAICNPKTVVGSPGQTFIDAMQNACGSAYPYGSLMGALVPPTGTSYSDLYQDGFREAVISTSWASIEPSEGVFSSATLGNIQTEINEANAAGLQTSLDIGTQYPPSWIFNVGGGTQFIDQYGNVFSGSSSSGNDIANAVTDMNVRSQLGDYIEYLGSNLTGVNAVRLGGVAYNELRYPSGNTTQKDSYWFYDQSSQASLPVSVQGWTPSTGTVAQATTFINAYNTALSNYGLWLIQQAATSFPPITKLELLLPGWGERTGEVSKAESNLLESTPDEINQGLDWADMLPEIAGSEQTIVNRIVAYSTYADATNGSSTNPDPAAFIHSILPAGMLQGGESTGNGNTTSSGEALMFQDAVQWNWYVANWFFNNQTQTPQQVYGAFANEY